MIDIASAWGGVLGLCVKAYGNCPTGGRLDVELCLLDVTMSHVGSWNAPTSVGAGERQLTLVVI